MSSMSVGANYLQATRAARLTGPDQVLNDASRRDYLFSEAIRDRASTDVVRGGTEVQERIKLNNVGNFRAYEPGSIRTTTRRQTLYTLRYAYRSYENDLPLAEYEKDLNEGDDFAQFKNFEKTVMADLNTDHWDGLEGLLFARPTTDMESLTVPGLAMNSVPLFITEDGLAPIGLTTIGQLAPATFTNWRNQRGTYDPAAPEDSVNGIFAAFDAMILAVDFKSPTGGKKYYEDSDLRKQKIITNSNGVTLYQRLLRAGNDTFAASAGGQDPAYPDPQYKGIPVRRTVSLDDATLDQVAGAYTNQAYPTGRPRYFWWHQKYLYPVFHKKHMMKEIAPINGGATQRDVDTLYMESWVQLICSSRRRHGIVVPS